MRKRRCDRSFGELWEQQPADVEWVFRVNVHGTLNLIRSFVPGMRRSGGQRRVIVTGSDACFLPMPYVAVYHATKHALVAITEGLAMELDAAGSAVAVHLVCPLGVKAPRLLSPDRFAFRAGGTGMSTDTTNGRLLKDLYTSSTRSRPGTRSPQPFCGAWTRVPSTCIPMTDCKSR